MRETEPRSHGFGATASNAVRVLAAESLMLPTGIVTAAFLTRQLGPADYGTFTLAATIASWLAWFAGAMFSRATVKLISANDHPAPETSPAIATMVRAYTGSGVTASVMLFASANALANLFHEPAIATYLRLFALEVALFAFTMVHKEILVGLGRFRERATCATARWISRMILV
ncbi:MAG TPA: oligosaccharide flippase family protein, partial [Candidatus Binatia bacterium]|nr:oligosaccharide flippase family protein [Candidatus Binatia bacterium]